MLKQPVAEAGGRAKCAVVLAGETCRHRKDLPDGDVSLALVCQGMPSRDEVVDFGFQAEPVPADGVGEGHAEGQAGEGLGHRGDVEPRDARTAVRSQLSTKDPVANDADGPRATAEVPLLVDSSEGEPVRVKASEVADLVRGRGAAPPTLRVGKGVLARSSVFTSAHRGTDSPNCAPAIEIAPRPARYQNVPGAWHYAVVHR